MSIILVRWILTTVLLYAVWMHAHWSVALCLTLLAVTLEVCAIATKIKRHRELARLEAKMRAWGWMDRKEGL